MKNKKFEEKKEKGKLVVAHFFPTFSIGGVEKTFSIFLNKFIDKNVNIILLTFKKKGLQLNLQKTIKRIEIFPSGNLYNIKEVKKIKKIVKEYKINILVNHFCQRRSERINFLFHNLGVKVIFFSHSTFINRSFKYKRNTLNMKNYDLFVTFLNFNMLYISKIYKDKHFLVVTNSLTLDIDNVKRSNLKEKNIIMIGRPEYTKNYEFGLKVLKKVTKKDKNIKLLIVGFNKGINPYSRFIISEVKKLKLEKNVIFKGITFDVGKYYRMASIYLMCSHYEACSNVITEAKMHGLATIVSGPTYIPAAKKGTINIKGYDVNKVSKLILNLFKNQTYLKEMSDYAYNNAIFVSDETLVKRWIKIYRALLSNDKKRLSKLKSKFNDYSSEAYKELDYWLEQEKISIKNRRAGYGGEKRFIISKRRRRRKSIN